MALSPFLYFTVAVLLVPVSAFAQKTPASAPAQEASVATLVYGDIMLRAQMPDGTLVTVVVSVSKIDKDCISRACNPMSYFGEPSLWGSAGAEFPPLNYIRKLTIGPDEGYPQGGSVRLSSFSDLTNITAVSDGGTPECRVLIKGGHHSRGYTACLSIDADGQIANRMVTGSPGSNKPNEKTIYSNPQETH